MFEIGTTLRQARERRQLGLDRCEAETKIRARYLRALEDEDFDVLPGPTFVRGFLRSYAHHLGLDGQLFVDEYNSRHFDPRDDDVFPRRRPTARERRNRKRESHIILIAIVAIVALAVLVIAAASYPGSEGRETPLPAATSAPQPTGVGNSALTVTTIAAATTATQEKSGQVTVVAERACYVTVYEGEGTKGRVLFSDTLDPDTKLDEVKLPRVEGGYTFELGNAGGVSFVVGDDRHLFSPDNMNVFWLDPDTETIKAVE
jgi:cytoskeletal protein RodZ